MRRTLIVLVATAACLVPAAAASAAPAGGHSNASCSNGKGGNLERQAPKFSYNGLGNVSKAAALCGAKPVVTPPVVEQDEEVVTPPVYDEVDF